METFGSLDLKAHPCWLSMSDWVMRDFLLICIFEASTDMSLVELALGTTWNVRDMLLFILGLVFGHGLARLAGTGFVSCKTFCSYWPGPGRVRISDLNRSLHVPKGTAPKFHEIYRFLSPSGYVVGL